MWVFPINRKRFINLEVLAGLYAAAAQNALIGVVAIERISVVDFVRLGPEWNVLMLNGQKLRGIVNCAVTVVVITDRAVEHVIAENPVVCFSLRGGGGIRFRINDDSIGNGCRAGPE